MDSLKLMLSRCILFQIKRSLTFSVLVEKNKKIRWKYVDFQYNFKYRHYN